MGRAQRPLFLYKLSLPCRLLKIAVRSRREEKLSPFAVAPLTPRATAPEGRRLREVEGKSRMDLLYPIGRIGNPDEVAELIVWLCSPRASFTTGADIAVDGGYVAQ